MVTRDLALPAPSGAGPVAVVASTSATTCGALHLGDVKPGAPPAPAPTLISWPGLVMQQIIHLGQGHQRRTPRLKKRRSKQIKSLAAPLRADDTGGAVPRPHNCPPRGSCARPSRQPTSAGLKIIFTLGPGSNFVPSLMCCFRTVSFLLLGGRRSTCPTSGRVWAALVEVKTGRNELQSDSWRTIWR